MHTVEVIVFFCFILIILFWIAFGDDLDEKPKPKSGYMEPDTNEEDFLEIFNNE